MESHGVDLQLYSRQIGEYGLETMTKFTNLKCLISGMKGLGMEIAKNLILSGPGKVTIHDDEFVELHDLGSGFFFSEADVNTCTRADACLSKLQQLNSYVEVDRVKGLITQSMLRRYDVLIITNYDKIRTEEMASACRACDVKFICVHTFGLAFSIFVDMGESFMVKDPNGEEAKSFVVDYINKNGRSLFIDCSDDSRLPFAPGDFCRLSGIRTQDPFLLALCDLELKVVGLHKKFSVEVELPEALAGCADRVWPVSGAVQEVKKGKLLKFRHYRDSCENPVPEGGQCLLSIDYGKPNRPEQLHIITQALLMSATELGRLPEISEVGRVVDIAERINHRFKEANVRVAVDAVDKKIVEFLVRFSTLSISALCVIAGGIVAQEIVKVTGKYTPIHQWLYYDCFELLQNIDYDSNPKEFEPVGCRYDDQIQLWGRSVQQVLQQVNIFLVGTGALGCEYLKNFAMLGVSTRPGKCVVVTDMDHIEVSNLSRQFLFRREHVGKPKSAIASIMARSMNEQMNIRALEARVGPETETELFTDEFWENLDVVVNALDNIPSRLYIDSKCVWHWKPLIESGTLGTKGNTQVVLPGLTESYGDSQDPPEQSIPLCTLRHFPHQIEHTIEWGRDLFHGQFTTTVQETANILKYGSKAIALLSSQMGEAQLVETLKRVKGLLEICHDGVTIEKCTQYAVEQFHELFYVNIAQLLHNFPLDHVNSNGTPFWCGSKRPPTPIKFNAQDPLHLQFVIAYSNLLAYITGLTSDSNGNKTTDLDAALIEDVADKVNLLPFKPKIVFIASTDEEAQETQTRGNEHEAIVVEVDELKNKIEKLVAANQGKVELIPVEFEKDDDSNYHIRFIAATGNLRARNYGIPEIDIWKAKILAGKIIPAIATTTAMITGFATVELIKVLVQKYLKLQLDAFRNTFSNLSLPFWIQSEPMTCKVHKSVDYDPIVGGPIRCKPPTFTNWDKFTVRLNENSTLKELVDQIEKEYDTEVSLLSAGNTCLYTSYGKNKAALQDTLSAVLQKLSKNANSDIDVKKGYCVVQACCMDSDGVDVNIPVIKCLYR